MLRDGRRARRAAGHGASRPPRRSLIKARKVCSSVCVCLNRAPRTSHPPGVRCTASFCLSAVRRAGRPAAVGRCGRDKVVRQSLDRCVFSYRFIRAVMFDVVQLQSGMNSR